ncbi:MULTISPECIES: hypothetical protein [unclassified Ruegeria]|uniref:hypothetical protein n=1 Tax=unclassified Ruegeria TaxID=2625375 RepID=UPI001488C7E0|nr:MULTISPECIES: hypothetical protein [unclassified Ruegeria]NOD75609.1 hypothetical protein [Ruegeria sp. HKCCD4332]NOD90985.1 hypothetical protein [Ruegeria sp. HKCCD4318]NOE16363.1 hypothetical protein [Ruegeria sp. HKCCD4318-2]NOG10154.1 hypothetical protein [Ruegeria sp. HKCCD4315]
MPTPLFKPGHSGNPGGRPKLDPETRKLIQSNGEIAVKRMNDLLSMNELFNRRDENGEFVSGKLSGKEQIALLALAQDRAFGRADGVSITHTHSGTVGMSVSPTQRLKDISDRLPERLAQQKVIEAKLDDNE